MSPVPLKTRWNGTHQAKRLAGYRVSNRKFDRHLNKRRCLGVRSSPVALPKPTRADGVIIGIGKIGGRDAAIAIYDFTVYGDSQDQFSHRKIDRIQHLAIDNGIPMVYLCAGGSPTTIQDSSGVSR